MKKTIHGTTSWIRHDIYMLTKPISRWLAFKAFIKGKLEIYWQIPATRKDKRLKLTGYIRTNNP